MYLNDPSREFLYLFFCIQMYFEAIHLKMKRNPYRCCFVFEILAFRNTKKISLKYIDVNVKCRLLTLFPGIQVIYFEKGSYECKKKN